MKKLIIISIFQLFAFAALAQPSAYQNVWTNAPQRIPNDSSVDAPLMGNGDVMMSVGFKSGELNYYLSKNDFWRLRSKADGLSGPRVTGIINIKIEGFKDAKFTAAQELRNGLTSTHLKNKEQFLDVQSWVSATDNLVMIELKAIDKPIKVSIGLTAPENKMALTKHGKQDDITWLSRAFVDSVDIATEAAIALKTLGYKGNTVLIEPGKPLLLALAVESNFKQKSPLAYVSKKIKKVDEKSVFSLLKKHDMWWDTYWAKSSIIVEDKILMKAYYQGLYTMAACSRDLKFPPGIFGWVTTDNPSWNGDYHLNYNFEAPFYGLHSANRLAQAAPHDAPLLNFMPRGEWYAQEVAGTRGILYPVGIGPLGIEVTRDFTKFIKSGNAESGGLFFGQRSNAAYGLLNMAQYWRTTYDLAYGKKIYPYALAVANFWEDYLNYEDGRYIITGDAIHEGSGLDINPILSLGLVRNVFELMIDLSTSMNVEKDRQAKWHDILNKLSDFPLQERNNKTVFRYTEKGVAWWNDNGLGIQHIYPSNAINLDSDEALLKISRNTIAEMKRWQDYNTASSFYMAAVRVGYDPEIVLKELQRYALRSYPNGFDFNNPHGIENSCVVQNALSEMLCMSVGSVIRLFNIPVGQDASFKNIRTWGAFLVSARLDKGVVSELMINSEKGKQVTLVNPWPGYEVTLIRNGKKAETLLGDRISFPTKVNESIAVVLSTTKSS